MNSFYDRQLEEGCAFEELISFHGGMGGPQTRPFLLYPERAAGSRSSRSSAPLRCTRSSPAGATLSRMNTCRRLRLVISRTTASSFRSLIHQLFTRDHSVRGPIRKAFQEKKVFGEPGKGWEWQLKELQDLFFNGLTDVAKTRAMTIFVDALDEAGSKAAEELVAYFHILNDRLSADNSATRICISCRHYPVVAAYSWSRNLC